MSTVMTMSTSDVSRRAIRLSYLEDNQGVAEAIATRFASDARFHWLGWHPTVERLVEAMKLERPDVIVMDLDVPGSSPLAFAQLLAIEAPEVRTLVFSGQVAAENIDQAIEAGAWGFVCKCDGDAALIQAVHEVAAGGFALSNTARKIYDLA